MDDADLQLRAEGFEPLGEFHYDLRFQLWWHAESRVQLAVLSLGSAWILKASKSYVLQSRTPEGETWAREIGPLHDYLEAHFPEFHLTFSYFRDITSALAEQHLDRSAEGRQPDRLEVLEQELRRRKQSLRSLQGIAQYTPDSPLLARHLESRVRDDRGRIGELEEEVGQSREERDLREQLLREYERKGSAACLLFSISSNVQVVAEPSEFRDRLRAVVKELSDLHRYQVEQKLSTGRLQVQITEATEPALTWLEEWSGGALSPRQIEQLPTIEQPTFREHLNVTLDEPIRVPGAQVEEQKRLGAWTTASLLQRLDSPDSRHPRLEDLGTDQTPLWIGRIEMNGKPTSTSASIPFQECGHIAATGTTGSGKSFFARVVVEEVAEAGVSVLVLDPTNQWAGLLLPEDRPEILRRYREFSMKKDSAKGFDFRYHAPGEGVGEPLPASLGTLADGHSIVCLKGLDDHRRCEIFTNVLLDVFDACSSQESTRSRLLVVIEEHHRFTKRRVPKDAQSAAQNAENVLERVIREGRKYGVHVLLIDQSIRDLAYGLAIARQNTRTKAMLQNSDRELDHAAELLPNPKEIVTLPPGSAFLCNPSWGVLRVRVRPPYSKVWEPSTEETQRLLDSPSITVSESAKELLKAVRDLHAEHGEAPNVGAIGERAGITSKRRLQRLLEELERTRCVTTSTLSRPGRPRVVTPMRADETDQTPDQGRSKPDETDSA